MSKVVVPPGVDRSQGLPSGVATADGRVLDGSAPTSVGATDGPRVGDAERPGARVLSPRCVLLGRGPTGSGPDGSEGDADGAGGAVRPLAGGGASGTAGDAGAPGETR